MKHYKVLKWNLNELTVTILTALLQWRWTRIWLISCIAVQSHSQTRKLYTADFTPRPKATMCTCYSLSLRKIWLELMQLFLLLHSHHLEIHDAPWKSLCEIMMTSTKLEVYKILQPCQKRTKQLPQATCIKNLVKFCNLVSEICKRTDKHTHHSTLHLSRGRRKRQSLWQWLKTLENDPIKII